MKKIKGFVRLGVHGFLLYKIKDFVFREKGSGPYYISMKYAKALISRIRKSRRSARYGPFEEDIIDDYFSLNDIIIYSNSKDVYKEIVDQIVNEKDALLKSSSIEITTVIKKSFETSPFDKESLQNDSFFGAF